MGSQASIRLILGLAVTLALATGRDTAAAPPHTNTIQAVRWDSLETGPLTPPGLTGHTAVYDSTGDRILIFGGESQGVFTNQVWSLSLAGPPRWSRIEATGLPLSVCRDAAAIWDPRGRRMLVFGGYTYLATSPNAVYVLSFDSTATWSALQPTGVAPLGRWGHSAVYDSKRHRMIVFGGRIERSFAYETNDVWALSLSGTPAWSAQRITGALPRERRSHAAAYDALRDRMLIAGGHIGTINDAWSLSFDSLTWSPILDEPTLPLTPAAGRAALHPFLDRFVLYNGIPRGLLIKLPTTTGVPWDVIVPSGRFPSTDNGHTVTYDPKRDRLIVFGGQETGNELHDTWAMSWGLPFAPGVACTGNPPWSAATDLRARYSIANPSDVAHRYEWALEGSRAWPGLPAHGAVTSAGFGLDTVTIVIPVPDTAAAGGITLHFTASLAGANGNPGTCEQELFDRTTPVLASIAGIEAEPHRVRVTWWIAGAETEIVGVERSRAGGAWRAAGVGSVDGRRQVVLDDADVVPGERLGYRIRVAGEPAAIGEVWVEVPLEASLALGRSGWDASTRAFHVRLTMPEAGSPRLTVWDVAGRRMLSRRLDHLTPGAHDVAIDAARGWPPGMYFLELSLGARTVTGRGVIAR